MVNGHCVRTTHAEANAIAQAARHGVSLAGSTAYATYQPCLSCTKLLISAGVARIVYGHAYPDELAAKLLTEVGIPVLYLTSFDALPPGSEAKSSL
jgi:dCMP deaminase